jgi:hypothetical protein
MNSVVKVSEGGIAMIVWKKFKPFDPEKYKTYLVSDGTFVKFAQYSFSERPHPSWWHGWRECAEEETLLADITHYAEINLPK